MRGGYELNEKLKQTLIELVRKTLGPIVVVDPILFVSKLPKTRSRKIMRRLIKAIVMDKPFGDYSTIEEVKKAIAKP